MVTTRQIDSSLEPAEVYLSRMLFKDHGIIVSPAKARNILARRLRHLMEESLREKRFRANYLAIGIQKKKSEDVPASERANWVFSDYSMQTLYTMGMTFKEEYKGYFKFKPSRSTLQRIREFISQKPEFEYNMYVKPEKL